MGSLEDDVERMGEILIEEGLIMQEDLEKAMQEVKGGSLGGVLQGMTCVRRSELAAFIGTDYQLPQASNLAEIKPSDSVLESITAELAVKLNVLPVAKAGGILFVAMSSPTVESLREVRKASGFRIKVLQAGAEALKTAIQDLYLKKPISVTANEPEVATGKEDDEAVPLVSSSEADDTAITQPPVRPAAPAPAAYDTTPVKLTAAKISMEEYRTCEQYQVLMRTIADWDANFVQGKPVPAIKIA